MSFITRWARSLALSAALVLGFATMAAQPAAAAAYVDNALGDLTADQKATVASPQPVQLLFHFLTKDKANPQAVKFLKDQVTEAVKGSGVFSEVSENPVAGGAVLSITIQNIPEEGAAGKGVGVGLTFGLAGAKVTDFYICTAEYLPPAGGEKITKVVNHAIHTTVGLKSPPPEGTKAKNTKEAVFLMTRQVVSHAVNAVAKDADFSGAAATTMTAEATPPAAEAAASAAEEAAPAVVPAAEPAAPEAAPATPAEAVAS